MDGHNNFFLESKTMKVDFRVFLPKLFHSITKNPLKKIFWTKCLNYF